MKLNRMNRLLFTAAALLIAGAPVRATEIDDQIEIAFKKSYVYKTYLHQDDVKAEARNGLVTLTGSVSEESHKTLAEETAANLPGVTRVENKLATPAELATENADTWIGRKVKLALLFNRKVNGFRTDVEVKDGVVTLRGEASSKAQKELATEYAQDIEGVKEVKNEMTVASAPVSAERTLGERIDDASVTAQVKTALLTHRLTSAITTRVTTKDGVVTVSGTAKNAVEKALVTQLASDINGVTSVRNEMTVAEAKTK